MNKAVMYSEIMILVCILSACSGGGMGGTSSHEYEKALSRSIDSAKYIDLTMPSADANTISKEDLLYVSAGTYRLGEAYIAINANKGTVALFNPSATIPGRAGTVRFEAEFPFSVFPANKHCLYLRQANRNELVVKLDGIEYKGNDVPDLICCVPFYGYGGSRLEVSPIMNGNIAMPSGTYWDK